MYTRLKEELLIKWKEEEDMFGMNTEEDNGSIEEEEEEEKFGMNTEEDNDSIEEEEER